MTKGFQDILRQRTTLSPPILDIRENYDDETKKTYFVRRPESYVVPINAASPEEALSIAANGSVEDLVKQNEQFKAKHTYGALSSAALGGLDGLSFGFDDEAAGALSAAPSFFSYLNPWSETTWDDVKKDYKRTRDNVREIHEDAKTSNPNTYFMGNLVGSVALPGTASLKGITLASKFAGTSARALTKRLAADMVEGAGYNIVDSIGHDNNIAIGAATGALGGALGNLAGETIFNPAAQHYLSSIVLNPVSKLRNATEAQMKGLTNEVQKSGITYGQPFKQNIADYSNRNIPQNYSPQFQENIKAFQDDLNKIADDNIPVNITRNLADRSKQLAENTPIEERQYFDNFGNWIDRRAANPREGEFASGKDAAFAMYQQLNGVKERLTKADTIQRMIDQGELRPHPNLENKGDYSQSVLGQLENKQIRFTPDEVESLNTVINGTPLQKWLQPLTEEFAGSKNSLGYAARKQIHEKAIQPLAKKISNLLEEKNNRELLGLALKGGGKKAVETSPNMIQRVLNAYGPEVVSYCGQKWLEDKLENSQP